jgi:putative oxidoreductase
MVRFAKLCEEPMTEIAIMRRVREAQERDRMAASSARWNAFERTALITGRALLGGYVLYSGIHHFRSRSMMTGYSASKGVPYPEAVVTGTGTMLMLGGLSLLVGVKPKFGAALISAFLLGVTPKMHDFWRLSDPQQRIGEQVNFLKNIGLLGGALLAAAMPEPWPASADQRRGTLRRTA